jgi:hypothetical protein
LLDAPSGFPRTGIVDAVLTRIAPTDPDQIEVKLVQLKSGSGGLKANEVRRLKRSSATLIVRPTAAWHDGRDLHFVDLGSPDGHP